VTHAEWKARRRAVLLALYTSGTLTPAEVIAPLLDSYTAGHEASEWAADEPAVRDAVRPFLAEHWPNPRVLPRPFLIGRRLSPEEASRLLQERVTKLAALLAACGLARIPPA